MGRVPAARKGRVRREARTGALFILGARLSISGARLRRYGAMLDTFIQYSHNEPGTHVSKVAEAMVEIMAAGRPQSSYKARAAHAACSHCSTVHSVHTSLFSCQVGDDSKGAPFCGLLPTGVRETVVKWSMYKNLGKC